MLRNVS